MAGQIGCFLLATLCLAGVSAIEWENLYLTYSLLTSGYYPIAFDQATLLEDSYVYMTTDSDLNVDFYSYGEDPTVSIGFDAYGNIAGVRVAFVINNLNKTAEANGLSFPYDYSTNAMYSNGTFWDEDVVYTQVLFVSPAVLAAGGRNVTNGVLGDNVYVKINGSYTALPKLETDAEAMGFTEQACFVGMGKHYFLGMTEDAECADLPGLFVLYEGGELIGLGLIPFGSYSSFNRNWFENPSSSVVKMIVPTRPTCLTEWVDDYGTIGLHFFFKAHPRLTLCL